MTTSLLSWPSHSSGQPRAGQIDPKRRSGNTLASKNEIQDMCASNSPVTRQAAAFGKQVLSWPHLCGDQLIKIELLKCAGFLQAMAQEVFSGQADTACPPARA